MKLHIKDPGSAITHFIGMIAAMFAATPLLIKAAREPDSIHLTALSIFIVSMILLYAASTIYHTLDISPEINKRLRKLDHMMIFILIAGTYTPVCMVVLGDKTGWNLLALVWGIAAARTRYLPESMKKHQLDARQHPSAAGFPAHRRLSLEKHPPAAR